MNWHSKKILRFFSFTFLLICRNKALFILTYMFYSLHVKHLHLFLKKILIYTHPTLASDSKTKVTLYAHWQTMKSLTSVREPRKSKRPVCSDPAIPVHIALKSNFRNTQTRAAALVDWSWFYVIMSAGLQFWCLC